MRRSALVLLAPGLALAAAAPPNPLEGRWTVDLSTDPAKPYTKLLELRLAPDGAVQGEFYDSRIEAGRWKTDRGRTCVSFRTTDGAGPYHSSACARGDRLEGQTWAEHRAFLFNWNATRAQPEP
jgi:hypothetical protein